MKKRIISVIIAFVISAMSAGPALAEDTSLYNEFRTVSLSGLKKLFNDNFSSFDISKNGNSYNDSQRCLIILEAYHSGFKSFDELNENVTKAAEELAYKESNPELLGLKGLANVNLAFESPAKTDPANVFAIDGREFIVLDDAADKNGEPMLFVMAKDYYGTVAVDPDNQGRWDDSNYRLLPYKLTNSMAFGSYTSNNLPESILRHLDILHEWNVEPGSGSGFTSETTLVAPISVISATEYKEYGEKIGLDSDTSLLYWTRTPVLGDVASHFTVNTAAPKTMSKNKGWGGNHLRPVFWLKGEFFKTEKLEGCGTNVTAYIDKIVDESDINALYSSKEIKKVFGSLSVEPGEITGNAVVGETLTAAYTYDGSIPIVRVDISWQRSPDRESWQTIDGANGETYTLTSDDAGCYIRAQFSPVFDSAVLKTGDVTYAEKTDAVYTDAGILQAVKEINAASDVGTLRGLFKKYEPLFHCDPSAEAFSDNAARIFMSDRVTTAQEVVFLYNQAIALDAFIKATDENAKERAESEYLLGLIPEYERLSEEQKSRVILNLFIFAAEPCKASGFIDKAEEYIMLERFNGAERYTAAELIKEYASRLNADISDLSAYQLEKAAAYVAGRDYGTDVGRLRSAVREGISHAKDIKTPSGPIEGMTTEKPSGGYIPPAREKPTPSAAEDDLFTDLEDVSWAAPAINSLARKGILEGSGDGTFLPDRQVTRNEFVKMIVTAFNIEMTERDLPYEDIAEDAWSRKYIAAAVDAGIISGIDDAHFGDGLNITREDAAVIAERVMKYKEVEMRSSSLTFSDSNEISDYALTAVAKMRYCGIMSGVSDDLFDPKGGTTRAMAAVLINNLLQYYENATRPEDTGGKDIAIKSFNDKYDLLIRLGILRNEFTEDKKITRGELAAMLAAYGKYDPSGSEKIFDDVPSNHRYYKEISAVYQNNILAGKTAKEFAPDAAATYGEAYNAVIAAAGYAGFEAGRREAEAALAKETIYARDTDELTSEMAKKLFFAALDIPVLDLTGNNGIKVTDKTILSHNFDTYKERGVVNAVAGMYIGGRAELTDDKIIITVNSKDYLYTANDNDYSDYLGHEVIYYYQETDDFYQVLVMYTPKTASKPLKLTFEDIDKAERDLSEITYYINGRSKKARISKNADFIYNGKSCYDITAADLDPDNGYITLIDTDNNDVYDVVRIDHYEYVMVAQIDMSERSVLDKFTWQQYSLDDDAADKIRITKNGRYIKLENVSKDDILAIAKSRDGKLLNAYVSDQKVTGLLESRSPSDYEIRVNSTTLKCIESFDFDGLNSDMNITVGLDWNGYAVGYYIEGTKTGTMFGYLYKIVENDAGDKLICNILTEDNEYISMDISDKVRINDKKASMSGVFEAFSGDRDSGSMIPQLVAYTVDAEGELAKLYTSHEPEGVSDTQTVPLVLNKKIASGTSTAAEAVYNSFGLTLDFEYNLFGSAVMFDITLEEGKLNKKESRVTTVSSNAIPSLSSPENLYIYNADKSRVSKLCVYEHRATGGNEGYKETFNTQAFVISKLTEQWDPKENEATTAYVGYHAGNPVQYTMSDNLKDSIDLSKIKQGDVLLVWLSGTTINRFRRLYTNEESDAYIDETDLLCNYGDHVYTGESIARGGTNWDYAYDWAQHILERAEGKSGSTAVGGTRWLSVFGSVDLIYKSERYTYPVVRLHVAGKDEPAGYTMDGSTRVYSYDTKNNTITVLDVNDLNVSSDRVVLTARYGNVRDVVIYKD